MAIDVYSIVVYCRSCAQNRTHDKSQQQFRLNFLESLLECKEMGIVGPVPKTK